MCLLFPHFFVPLSALLMVLMTTWALQNWISIWGRLLLLVCDSYVCGCMYPFAHRLCLTHILECICSAASNMCFSSNSSMSFIPKHFCFLKSLVYERSKSDSTNFLAEQTWPKLLVSAWWMPPVYSPSVAVGASSGFIGPKTISKY